MVELTTIYNLANDALVADGLTRLRDEAFGPAGFAKGMTEARATLIHHTGGTSWHGTMKGDNKTIYMSGDARFSRAAWDDWLETCHVRFFRPGYGTWTSAEVAVFSNAVGMAAFFDEEHLERDLDGEWYPGQHPSNGHTWAQRLLTYPRTVDNIAPWMWDIFRAEGITPPVYNPQFNSVDWKNRRRPVTDRGTDFSVAPTIIDPSKEPGLAAWIRRKLAGS